MNEQHGDILSENDALKQSWQELPFDAATNFSLLGWILDKIIKRNKSEAKIDLTLDD